MAASPAVADPVRIGLIGTGRIGGSHAPLLARRVPGARLVALADATPVSSAWKPGSLGVAGQPYCHRPSPLPRSLHPVTGAGPPSRIAPSGRMTSAHPLGSSDGDMQPFELLSASGCDVHPRRALTAVATAILLTGCASRNGADEAGGGQVTGRVLSAPSCPVERVERPCPPRPVAGAAVIAYLADRRRAATIRAGCSASACRPATTASKRPIPALTPLRPAKK